VLIKVSEDTSRTVSNTVSETLTSKIKHVQSYAFECVDGCATQFGHWGRFEAMTNILQDSHSNFSIF